MKWCSKHTLRKVIAQTNMFDAMLGFALGGIFVKLVNSFVVNILTPPLGALFGGKDFSNWEVGLTFWPGNEPVLFRYGLFIDAFLQFLLVAIAVYWAARIVLKVKQSGAAKLQQTKECTACAMSIPEKARLCPYCQTELLKMD